MDDGRGAGGRAEGIGRAGGADAAAERRLAEALRAQASLGARTTATPPAGALARAAQPPAGATAGPPHTGAPASGPQNSGPQKAGVPKAGPAKKAPAPPAVPPGSAVTSAAKAAQPGAGPGGPVAAGRGGGGQRVRDRADAQPTEKMGADAGLAGAPTTQQPSAHTAHTAHKGSHKGGKPGGSAPGRTPHPAKPPTAAPPAPGPAGPGPQALPVRPAAPAPPVDRAGSEPAAARAVPLHWVLLAALVAGALLGCLLAVLSVLDSGLFPALG